jgi:sugar phosphate isomerase/epimerase
MMSGAALISPSALAHTGKHIPPGIQLWTVKEDAARDFEGTLKELARIGYKRVEGAGWHGRSAAQVRKALADARLEMPAAHYGLQTLIDETDASLRFAREVGAKYVVASSPAPRRKLDPKKPWSEGVAEAMSLADWRWNAEEMEKIGRKARAMGLRFAYHNHSAELIPYEGRLPLDEIVRLTNPRNVALELDIGWVAGAGHDPVPIIRKYQRRIELLHIKDLVTKERTPGKMVKDERTTVIGQGTLNWRPIFNALKQSPVHSYFVEQEEPFTEPPLKAAAKSLAYMLALHV